MARSQKQSPDNVAGIQGNVLVRILLFPGMFYQWLQFMMVGQRHYSSVAQRTRMARSPAMTWVYSAVFYVALYFLFAYVWR